MPKRTDIAELVSRITTDLRGIVSDEIALAKAEIKPALTRLLTGGALFIGAVVLALGAGALTWLGVAAAFAWLLAAQTSLSVWACVLLGLVCAIVLFLLLAVMLVALGYSRIKSARAPELTPASVRQSIAAVQQGVERGLALAEGDSDVSPGDQPDLLR
ncbi:MAG: phage holin family protein [Propionibacteriaceae bacterium]|jgi:membrane protein implicated in regulation of membrane protease activity|nr:phage holin family protein [Propionibacteriaceae bacterium]